VRTSFVVHLTEPNLPPSRSPTELMSNDGSISRWMTDGKGDGVRLGGQDDGPALGPPEGTAHRVGLGRAEEAAAAATLDGGVVGEAGASRALPDGGDLRLGRGGFRLQPGAGRGGLASPGLGRACDGAQEAGAHSTAR